MDVAGLQKSAAAQEKALVAFAQRLIQTPSLPGQEGDAARLVRSEMQSLGYDDTWIDEVGNVVGVIRGTGGGSSLMFNTHLDHVDIGDESGWRFPPYAGQISDGVLSGRGAVDIKGPTAAQVYGVALLKQAGVALPGDVYVAGAVQEEIGGLGSLELARTTRTDRAVIGEASSNELRRGHRGRIELIVRITGEACHASAPERGINPHYSLGSFLTALREEETLEDAFLGPETFAPTLLFTDQTSSNVIPGEVRLHIDWRTVPQRGPEDIRAEVARRLDASLLDGASGEVTVKELRLRAWTGSKGVAGCVSLARDRGFGPDVGPRSRRARGSFRPPGAGRPVDLRDRRRAPVRRRHSLHRIRAGRRAPRPHQPRARRDRRPVHGCHRERRTGRRAHRCALKPVCGGGRS